MSYTYKCKLRLTPQQHIKLLRLTGWHLEEVLEDYAQRILDGHVEPEEIHNAVKRREERR